MFSTRLMIRNCNALKHSPARAMSSNTANLELYKYETLEVTTPNDFVLHVALNRPEKLNAMNGEMWNEMISCFNNAAKDSNVRAIIVSGNGKLFTAGLDLMGMGGNLAPDPNRDVARNTFKLIDFIKACQESNNVIERCDKPVVAAIHGACIGGGVDLVTATDIRLCTKDAYFRVKEVDIGLAADIGTLQRLPKVIGNDSLARELCFTARKLKSDEALQVGLVSRIFEDKESVMEGAIELASVIASKSPVAVQSTKHHINYARDHTVQESLNYMAIWNGVMLQSEDIIKSAEAFVMKKSPADVTYSKL